MSVTTAGSIRHGTSPRPHPTSSNSRKEGVADRGKVPHRGHAEHPFTYGSFDVVVSMNAIHNLYAAADRDKAITAITRVISWRIGCCSWISATPTGTRRGSGEAAARTFSG
jgi:hypothetical protein